MRVLGLDIGGANIKAAHAHISTAGDVTEVRAFSQPFALWRAPEHCAMMLMKTAELMGPFDALAVTMTGELCDCFASRRDGVLHILNAVEEVATGAITRIWSVRGGFISTSESRSNWLDVASANWHALATHAARLYPTGLNLVIDVGSTTTDIIRIRDGMIEAQGKSDAQRLVSGELVYTGVSRTPLHAVMNQWHDGAVKHRIMAERFATTADVHVLLGDIPEDAADCDTADGRPMLREQAANRVLRMIGSDLSTSDVDKAVIWARRFVKEQLNQISQAIFDVLAGEIPGCVIVSGSGAFLASRAALQALPNCEVIEWHTIMGAQASSAACAAALLHLWHEYHLENRQL